MINREQLNALYSAECAVFDTAHPRSKALADKGLQSMLFGVPMHWMRDWSTPFPLFVDSAQGAHIVCADGHTLNDFCLGDTGAMFGHAPECLAQAISTQMHRGLTTMLPSPLTIEITRLLSEQFGLPTWQWAMTATDANRYVLRWLRAITGRSVVLVFNGCYHGTVEDAFVDLIDEKSVQRPSLLGQPHSLLDTTRVIEFNDLSALENALASNDVACVLAEPVMTNVGMVLPQPDFWANAQPIIKSHGTYLVLDETHTLSSGVGGYGRVNGLSPDAIVVGKAIGGGVPCAVYGFSAELAHRAEEVKRKAPPGHSGIGTTLTANALAQSALHATLSTLITSENFNRMTSGANRLADGLRRLINAHDLPWCVVNIGARVEFQFCPSLPQNGTQARAAMDDELEQTIHLCLLNRGQLITPFHNMMLVCPQTNTAHIDRFLQVFDEVLGLITLR